MSESESKLQTILGNLGFSEIETKVYVFLLKESPTTGYRISHGIGKPTANTYKAISALQEKGAILIDDGEKRLVRPVRPHELLAHLERRYLKQCAEAEAILETIGKEMPDERVWQLSSVPQVYERARTMIAAAQEIILADVFPAQMTELRDDFERASARGVAVYVVVYESLDEVSFKTAIGSTSLENLNWPGNQLNLVTDASEHLLCMFTRNNLRIHQAIWSNSAFLSCLHHNHISMEILMKSLSPEDQERFVYSQSASEILLCNANPPGLRHMIETIGENISTETSKGETP